MIEINIKRFDIGDFLTAIEVVATAMPGTLSRSQNYFDLSDADGPSPYQTGLNYIDFAIGRLKTLRRDVQELSQHEHDWSPETGFCYICGADGNA